MEHYIYHSGFHSRKHNECTCSHSHTDQISEARRKRRLQRIQSDLRVAFLYESRSMGEKKGHPDLHICFFWLGRLNITELRQNLCTWLREDFFQLFLNSFVFFCRESKNGGISFIHVGLAVNCLTLSDTKCVFASRSVCALPSHFSPRQRERVRPLSLYLSN